MNYSGDIVGNDEYIPTVLPMFDNGRIGRLMFKRITSVNIGFAGAAKTFQDVMSDIRNAQYVRPCDMLELYDLVHLRTNPSARDGEAVLIISGFAPNAAEAKKIAKRSVSGIYRLISRTNGFVIDLHGDELEQIESTRFYFCSRKNAEAKAALMRSWGMYARIVGIAGGNRVCISSDMQTRMDILKSDLYDADDNRVDITCDHMQYYLRSFNETTAYSSLSAACSASALDVGHGGDLPSLVASLLGVYAACKAYDIGSLRMRYHIGYTVAARRDITLHDGTVVSLFDPTDRACGRITPQSLRHMHSVLRGLAAGGEITAAMLVRGGIQDTLKSVLHDGAVFVSEISSTYNVADGAIIAFGSRATGGARIGRIIKNGESAQ